MPPRWNLRTGSRSLGADALAARKGLKEPGGLPREDLLDAEFAGQDVAMENKSAGVGSTLVDAGHGQIPVVGSREMAINWHSIHLGFKIAARNPGSGWRRPYLIEF